MTKKTLSAEDTKSLIANLGDENKADQAIRSLVKEIDGIVHNPVTDEFPEFIKELLSAIDRPDKPGDSENVVKLFISQIDNTFIQNVIHYVICYASVFSSRRIMIDGLTTSGVTISKYPLLPLAATHTLHCCRDSACRVSAVLLLEKVIDDRCSRGELFTAAYQDPDPLVRKTIVQVFGRVICNQLTQSKDIFAAAFNTPGSDAQQAATKALQSAINKYKDAVIVLETASTDIDSSVQEAAKQGLENTES